jgi:hypothetical protein
MPDQPSDSEKKPQNASSPKVVKSHLQPSGAVVVEHHTTPPTGPADLNIHVRRPLPPVPKPPSEEDKKDK